MSTLTNPLLESLAAARAIPLLTVEDPEDALPLARALHEGGCSVLEIALRTARALEAIELITDRLPSLTVAAGTVSTEAALRGASEAGAHFAVSPGATPTLLRAAKRLDFPLLPGAATPSELQLGIENGYRCFKFFPAEAMGGIATLRSFSGPFPDLCFCATGGIDETNVSAYLDLPNVTSVVGSWLVPKDALRQRDWSAITRHVSRVFDCL